MRPREFRDPGTPREWREFARYVAAVAGLAGEEVSLAALQRAAEAAVAGDDASRRVPARLVLGALEAAREGRAFRPSLVR